MIDASQRLIDHNDLATAELSALAGEFVGTDRIQASRWTDGGTAAVEAAGSWELDGGVLVQRWRDLLSSGPFEALNVFMPDSTSGEVLLYSFDSLGYPADPPARGGWTDGSLTLVRATERGQSKVEFTPTDDGFRWSKRFRTTADEAWALVVEGELARVAREGS